MIEAYGPHLILDGYGCNASRLASIEVVYEYLEMMPDLIQMTRVMPPYAFKFWPKPGRPDDEQGISGFVIIAESHISVHTYPERAMDEDRPSLLIDIFSCRDFDVGLAERHTAAFFGAVRYNANLTQRGLEYPRCIPTVASHLIEERKGGNS
jgi:S-adenosylmethionine decarboxylase